MTKHLDLETIATYLDDPAGEESQAARQHLLDCRQCRQRAGDMQTLLTHLQEVVPYLGQQAASLDEQQIDWLNHIQTPAAKRFVSHTLQNDPDLMRAALYYVNQKTTPAGETGTSPETATMVRPPLHERVQRFFSWKAPVSLMSTSFSFSSFCSR